MYEERAQEIADKRYNMDFYDLPEKKQYEVYEQAMQDIDERLREMADMKREEMEMNGVRNLRRRLKRRW